MPTPVSETATVADAGELCSRTSIRPPSGVNLQAFDRMFHTTCCKRSASPLTTGPSSTSRLSATPLAAAAGRTASAASATTRASDTGCRCSVARPPIMREMSRTSAINCAWALALRSMMARMSSTRFASKRACRSIETQPRMALSGVRSSCDTIARNSSFS
ncbi:hypothetical protein D3C83_06170 [compost metagenome]